MSLHPFKKKPLPTSSTCYLCLSPGQDLNKGPFKGGGSISILFSVFVLGPKLLKLLLFNLKVNHFSQLWVELSNSLIQSLRGCGWLIANACKLLGYQVIQFCSSSTALSGLVFSMSVRGCTTPLVIDIYAFA